ncbi:transposase family protein [Desulfosarcina ovata]|uniref:H repeat-associated protein N-terminal domain-containing protein n=1 Tax=Desulfosarcina ovata subsp. ovata TaxID=2752305 RepID=A0A5K8ADS7_9BACT|nr:transposase family protein [Desulfosarcina ovata]BBO90497.1 hypothetical protein DSCOOX_36770 [Desulfosarcina ovata subsp. ovata]BBO90721.1 hypothetical protein DSCOOX_39010 [Desulfosarcina ovata subsp. ovata]BBO91102.1 hypothetical protein DSCOOX_42820 [Desulfosarcina ovata subsp. ovata]
MKKTSRRPSREQIKAQIKQRKHAQKKLRQDEKAKGFKAPSHATISNGKCKYESIEQEYTARNEAVAEKIGIFRAKMPVLLKQLSKIEDPRNPKKIKHNLSTLMIYGILMFVFQMSSSREANREMSRPLFWQNLQFFFPELESLPHHDTLKRLLAVIDVNQIEQLHLELIRQLIRKKKFRRYLIDECYPIAIDGTGKFKRDWIWAEECLQRTVTQADGEHLQYHVYILEANLAFRDGMTIPLMSEMLSYTEGDTANDKQDCELKAFYRLAQRLKSAFPALKIMVLIDGLYAKGPVVEVCRKNKWQFMIVLKDKSLPSVMSEFEALAALEIKNRFRQGWGNRKQVFKWVNSIDYRFGPNDKKSQILHVVECQERWQQVNPQTGQLEDKSSRHVWLSSKPLNRFNLHERCNLGARARWGIETGILVEKHHGYRYEHCFSYNWNVMKGYHYLMRLGHMFNVLARYSERLAKVVKDTGVRGLIHFIRETIANPWLDYEWLEIRLAAPFQLRLV